MRFKPFLALLLLSSFPVFAEDYLHEIEDIVQNEMLLDSSAVVPSKLAANIEGATSVSKSSSMVEILSAVENCKNNQNTTTKVEEDDVTVYGMSCKNNKSELISSELVVKNIDGKMQIQNYQEMTMQARPLTPEQLTRYALDYDLESLPSTAPVSPAVHTMITIAKVAVPVTLSLKTAKALSPKRTDWQKHFIAGAIISGATVLTAQGLLYAYNKKRANKLSTIKINMLASLAGFIASVGAGVAKEVYDKQCKCGYPEKEDIYYTAAGGMFVAASVNIPLELIFARRTRTAPQPF